MLWLPDGIATPEDTGVLEPTNADAVQGTVPPCLVTNALALLRIVRGHQE